MTVAAFNPQVSFSLWIVLMTGFATAQTSYLGATRNPLADTFISEQVPNVQFGIEQRLDAENSIVQEKQIVMAFTFVDADFGGDYEDNAQLELTRRDGNVMPGKLVVEKIEGSSWDSPPDQPSLVESSLTWNVFTNAQTSSVQAIGSADVTLAQTTVTVDIELDKLKPADGTDKTTLLITEDTGINGGLSFESNEASDTSKRPQLKLTRKSMTMMMMRRTKRTNGKQNASSLRGFRGRRRV